MRNCNIRDARYHPRSLVNVEVEQKLGDGFLAHAGFLRRVLFLRGVLCLFGRAGRGFDDRSRRSGRHLARFDVLHEHLEVFVARLGLIVFEGVDRRQLFVGNDPLGNCGVSRPRTRRGGIDALDPKLDLTDRQLVPRLKHLLFVDLPAVHERAVGAAEVLDDQLAFLLEKLTVASTYLRQRDSQLATVLTADDRDAVGQPHGLRRTPAANDDKLIVHESLSRDVLTLFYPGRRSAPARTKRPKTARPRFSRARRPAIDWSSAVYPLNSQGFYRVDRPDANDFAGPVRKMLPRSKVRRRRGTASVRSDEGEKRVERRLSQEHHSQATHAGTATGTIVQR